MRKSSTTLGMSNLPPKFVACQLLRPNDASWLYCNHQSHQSRWHRWEPGLPVCTLLHPFFCFTVDSRVACGLAGKALTICLLTHPSPYCTYACLLIRCYANMPRGHSLWIYLFDVRRLSILLSLYASCISVDSVSCTSSVPSYHLMYNLTICNRITML
jgi:hypothetical protein